jgi:hypothetical protein
MNIFYYFLGGAIFTIFNVLYDVFKLNMDGGKSLNLNPSALLQYGILGILSALAFFIADYALFKKKP